MFIIGVSDNDPCLVVSFVNDSYSVSPCKVFYDPDVVDSPFSVLTRANCGSNDKISFDNLVSVIIHMSQLSSFYPGIDKFEKLGMTKC